MSWSETGKSDRLVFTELTSWLLVVPDQTSACLGTIDLPPIGRLGVPPQPLSSLGVEAFETYHNVGCVVGCTE